MTERTKMPVLNADLRATSFDEVALGFTEEQALKEANRCLHCKNPMCKSGCPVQIDIPEFIAQIKQKNYEKAFEIIYSSNRLPSITGRVCPQETQCEKKCVLGIKGEPVAIGSLERFVADYHRKNTGENGEINGQNQKTFNGFNVEHDFDDSFMLPSEKTKIAVIGSGPCGLTAAGELLSMGYSVTVFEALHKGGGVLSYGIPSFRLPKNIVDGEISALKKAGVKFVFNALAGCSFTVENLKKWGYKSIIVCCGAGLPRFMGIDGEELSGVLSANEYLTRINLMGAFKDNSSTPVFRGGKIIVVGGGNVAMDAARSAVRSGADVTVVYRRSENELPARREEYIHAIQEGVKFCFLTNPVKIIGDESGAVRKIVVQKMQLTQPDASGRIAVRPIENSEYEIDADHVIMAIGTLANPVMKKILPEIIGSKGTVLTDENGCTCVPGVFAGGDAASGAATVILAMQAGKRAAKSVDEYIKSLDKQA